MKKLLENIKQTLGARELRTWIKSHTQSYVAY